MINAARHGHAPSVAWARLSGGLLLCLSACVIERAGLRAAREQTQPAEASETRDARTPETRDARTPAARDARTPAARDASSMAENDPDSCEDASIGSGAVSGEEEPGRDGGRQAWPDAGAEDASRPDRCPGDAGLCGCDVPVIDSDRDSTPDCRDACPSDPQKVAPGSCGCGEEERDKDRDGVMDCEDACPRDSKKADEGACGCGKPDADQDGNGTPDCLEPRRRGR